MRSQKRARIGVGHRCSPRHVSVVNVRVVKGLSRGSSGRLERSCRGLLRVQGFVEVQMVEEVEG